MLLAWLLFVWSSTSINEPSSISLNGPPGVSLTIEFIKSVMFFYRIKVLFAFLACPVFLFFSVLFYWSNTILFICRTKKWVCMHYHHSYSILPCEPWIEEQYEKQERRKREEKKRKHGRASDEWKGTITHPIASSAHTYTRTRRAHYLWFYLQNADFSKQTTTNGRKPSSTVLFCCAFGSRFTRTYTH
jgi:hypothetical protein